MNQYMALSKSKADENPDELFVANKNPMSLDEAEKFVLSLSESFYDIKIVKIIVSYDDVKEARVFI